MFVSIFLFSLQLHAIDYPDNIIDTANCVGAIPPTAWGIKAAQSSALEVSTLLIPLVGDLNDDGYPEIVCFGQAGETTIATFAQGEKTILIYDGRNLAKMTTITLPSHVSAWDGAAYGLVKLPNRKGLIVVATIDYKLRAYDYEGNLVWTSRSGEDYGSGEANENAQFGVNVSFADFNGDGHPEVYVRNKIYDAETGYLLGTASGGSNSGSAWAHTIDGPGWKLSSPIAADVLGEGALQLILGNEIYRVNIADRNATNNAITLAKTITPPTGVIADGHAQIADFDNDGYLDVLITNRSGVSSGTVSAYVWNVFNSTVSNPLNITMGGQGKSIPLIGDVDNDGSLEIVIQCNISGDSRKIRCYKYDVATQSFSFLWGYAPDEDSWSNGATLFDFNNDGVNEVLISDQASIRILNGTTGATISYFNYGETTVMQYPIVADVDGDGSAEIVAVGIAGGTGTSNFLGTLNIFKSSGTPWASARKVWNQYMYNSVNINEDLTVPSVWFNPATVFAGKDKVLGTSDDLRPYNNFLQQQTVRSQYGFPFITLMNVEYNGAMQKIYYSSGDSLVITIPIGNVGDAPIQSPFYVSVYKDSVAVANRLFTDSLMKVLQPDSSAVARITIRNYASFSVCNPSLNKFIINLNDKGNGLPAQETCDTLPDIAELNISDIRFSVPLTISAAVSNPFLTVHLSSSFPGNVISKGFEYRLSTNSSWTTIPINVNAAFEWYTPTLANGKYFLRAFVEMSCGRIYSEEKFIVVKCDSCK